MADRELDHKGLGHALLISLGGKPEAKGDGEDDGETGAVSDKELRSAADAVFDALQAQDREAFAEALHTYTKLCAMAGEGDDY